MSPGSVLQEVAAARHILIKCGPTEIDGHAFCSGLNALKLSYDTCPDLQALIGSVTYLIRGAIFRPRYVTSQAGRFSLDIRPLSELVELYHTRKATKNHDKVYALLGMSSDPSVAGLSVNYDMPWEQLFQKLVNFFVSEYVSVDTWADKEIAVIKGKGCILGEVSSVERDTASGDREILEISWKHAPSSFGMKEKWSSRWTLQALATSVQIGDAVCLLQGASRPTIVRLYDDYWAIIRIAVSPTDDLRVTSGDIKLPELTTDFLLVWDWDMYPDKLQDRKDYEWYESNRGIMRSKTEWEDYLDKATRLHNVGLVLQDMTRQEEAMEKSRKAQGVFEKALRSMGSQKLTCDGLSQSKGDVEKLEVVAGLFIRGGWPQLCLAAESGRKAIVKLLLDSGKVDPDAKDKDGQTPLLQAAAHGHAAVVKLLLDSGKFDPEAKNPWGQMPISLAAMNGHAAVIKLLLDSGKVDPDAKNSSGQTPLWIAVATRQEAVIKLLLNSGKVDPNAKEQWGQTPLWQAAEKGHEVVIKLLLDSGKVDPNAKDKDGRTPLWIAAEKGHEVVVKMLQRRP
ncbi:hypothetical protein IL306_006504 [Fusarium sp. DS 682]|nr:hypothetical protein IL306_006504 [Fusarium sp. DS 682]